MTAVTVTRPSGARLRPAILLTATLFALLIIVAMVQGQPETEKPFDLDSPGPGGLLGLRLWLTEMDYQVQRIDGVNFELPADVDLLFVYPHAEPYSEEEARLLYEWVEHGHTLALVGATASDIDLNERFGYDVGPNRPSTRLTQEQPLLPEVDPELPYLSLGSAMQMASTPEAVPVLVSDTEAVLAAVRRIGDGTVWYLDSQIDFTNAKLQAGVHGQLLPPLLRHVPEHGTIAFDTYHLYGRVAEGNPAAVPTSLRKWFTQTATGRALLFVVGMLLIFILLSGWRLGPPLSIAQRSRRREAGEHVTAMASLLQRAQHRQVIAHHHKRRLKVGLGRSYHVNAELPDSQFVEHLSRDGTAGRRLPADTADLLARLDNVAGEEMLVQAVGQVDQLLSQAPARQPAGGSHDIA